MVSFHEVRLPTDIERGAVGGPGFRTSVFTLDSGEERRNIEWSKVRGEWDISYGVQTHEDMKRVIDFFYARNGKGYGWRFKDWLDFKIVGPQLIGTGDGAQTAWQVFKRYEGAGSYPFDRPIYKLVTGTVLFYDNDAPITPTSIDYNTGIITKSGPAITAGHTVKVECEFDCAVRFDRDTLRMRAEAYAGEEGTQGAVESIPVVELKRP